MDTFSYIQNSIIISRGVISIDFIFMLSYQSVSPVKSSIGMTAAMNAIGVNKSSDIEESK